MGDSKNTRNNFVPRDFADRERSIFGGRSYRVRKQAEQQLADKESLPKVFVNGDLSDPS